MLAAVAVAQRHGELASYMEPLIIESTHNGGNGNGSHAGERVCVLHKRIPFVYPNGAAQGRLRVVVPVDLKGDVDAHLNDHRAFTGTYELSEIPSSAPTRLNVTVAAATSRTPTCSSCPPRCR